MTGNNLKTCIALIFILILAAGCDQYTKRKILVFIFPPLGKEKKAVIIKEGAEMPSQATEKKAIVKLTHFIHGPKAQNQCSQCHESSGTYSFRKPDTQGVVIPSLGDVSGRLVMPLSELCVDCHTSKSPESAYRKQLWLHGPAAQGECILCHQPHQSEYRYLLLKKNSIEVCTGCHSKGLMRESESHKTGDECTSCHNPHAGKDSLLLKKDYNEQF
ncbi:MAG: cytochrome c3 family protein [Nitrospirota bacterium]